ncbi:MAG TPA: FGGY-family carbohydrate kinase [Anaerolineales bacterium]
MMADVHPNPVLLAIDLGTSGPKVGLVSSEGEVLGCEAEAVPLILLPEGGAEQNPEDWWQGIVKATRRLLSRGLAAFDQIAAVSCTTQWSGTVPVDRDGKPLMNAVIWMDLRGAKYIDRAVDGPLAIEGYGLAKLVSWLRIAGGVPSHTGKDPISHILFIRNEHPEIYRQTYKFLEPKDYLNLRLTGRFAASYDSICLHWVTDNRDIARVDYEPGLLRNGGIEREKLPDLTQAVDILGTLTPASAADLGLPAEVKVVAGTPDVQSAALGSGAIRDYQTHLYLGTSSWLTCHVPYKKTDLFHNMASLPSAIPGRYLLANEQECAGKCLNYLLDDVFFPDDELSAGPRPSNGYDLLNQAAAKAPPGSDKLIFTPWLYGERSPIDDARVRGGFFNQTLRTTRAHLVRAVFEGVAYNSRWLLMYVENWWAEGFGRGQKWGRRGKEAPECMKKSMS